jgi:hypothetical protein
VEIAAVIFAIGVGVLILAGYFVPALAALQSVFLGWAVILAGAATIVGVFNLVLVHAGRISNQEKGRVYSAILLICLLGTFMFGLAMGPAHPVMGDVINAIVVPIESSLMALLAVSLLYASVRFLQRRTDAMGIVFLATAAVILLASATLPFGQVGVLNDFLRPWLQHVLALGGARGLLIGIGLGTLTTGLRVLLGASRPYGTK